MRGMTLTKTPFEIEHTYGKSNPYSVGVEEEFQLVHAETFELVSRIDVLLQNATELDLQYIKPELMQSVVETATSVCKTAGEAHDDLVATRKRLAELAEQSDCRICSSGTHPFSRYEFQKITDRERYVDIISRLKWVAQRELIFGLHVHVGIDSTNKVMAIFNAIRTYLPEMLALSANSPFWQGRHTGLQSTRVKVFDSFPRSGMPQSFDGWDEWCSLIGRAARIGSFPDYTYVWWDVRPHPRFGTIEVRICDAQTDVRRSVALAALVQATCAWLGDLYDRGEQPELQPQLLINENKWSAARYGLQGEFIDFQSDTTIPTRDAVERLLEQTRPYAAQLDSAEQFGWLQGMLDQTGARRQLDQYANSESLLSVAETLMRETNDLPQ